MVQDAPSSSPAEQPRRFTRGRLSRGKGLRKTTGCVTCRRRHVKCDEGKPRCGGCTRKKTRCDYPKPQGLDGHARQRSDAKDNVNVNDDAHTDTSLLDQDEASGAGEGEYMSDNEAPQVRPMGGNEHPSLTASLSPSLQTSPMQSRSDSRTENINRAYQSEPIRSIFTDDGQLNSTNSTGHVNTGNQGQVESPQTSRGHDGVTELHHLHSMVYQISPPSQMPFHPLPSMSYASSPDTSLTLKWLDLLVGDATLNYGPLPDLHIVPDGTNIFGNSAIQSPTILPETRAIVDDTEPEEASEPQHPASARVETRNAYLKERLPITKDQFREKEKAWQALVPISLQTKELVLIRHFTDHISPWMDLFEPQKPFGTLVPHLALHNVGLMNAILALSARHLDIRNRDKQSAYSDEIRLDQNDIIGYYYTTLHYCQEAMQYDSYKTSLELLASAFIISAYEMLDGPNTDWEKHLKGVFWIQRSQTIHGHSEGLRQAVWWAWLCQDVWAAFREKRRPFTFWTPTRSMADLNPSEIAAQAVYNFAHVVGFCAQEDNSNVSDYTAVKTRDAKVLSQQLDHWQSYLSLEFQPLPTVSGDPDNEPFPILWIQPSSFAAAMQLYYCSRILLELHRPSIGGYEETLDKRRTLKRWASNVCGIAKSSDDQASSVLSSQCIFIAGMVVESSNQRTAILELLDKCRQRAAWPSYSLGGELQNIWQE